MSRNKRTIPEIRARLRDLAIEHGIAELSEIADELYRNSPVTRAKVKSAPLTPQLADEIRTYVQANPALHQREVAEHFNVNPGRISEALNNLV